MPTQARDAAARAAERRRARPRRSGAPARGALRHPAARRADQPPGSRDDAVARAIPAGDRPRRSCSSATTAPSSRRWSITCCTSRADTATPYTGGYEAFVAAAPGAPARAAARVRQAAEGDRRAGGLHRAQHRRPEHQAGQGAPQAARAPAASQRAGRRGGHDGAAPRDRRAWRRSGRRGGATCTISVPASAC